MTSTMYVRGEVIDPWAALEVPKDKGWRPMRSRNHRRMFCKRHVGQGRNEQGWKADPERLDGLKTPDPDGYREVRIW